MRNMGIAPFNIASSVILITAQRLARRLCPNCKTPADIPRETLLEAGFKEHDVDGSWTPYRPVGCSMCTNGYKGRVGIYQVMPISDEIQRIVLRDGNAPEIAAQAELEGVREPASVGFAQGKNGNDFAGRGLGLHQCLGGRPLGLLHRASDEAASGLKIAANNREHHGNSSIQRRQRIRFRVGRQRPWRKTGARRDTRIR